MKNVKQCDKNPVAAHFGVARPHLTIRLNEEFSETRNKKWHRLNGPQMKAGND